MPDENQKNTKQCRKCHTFYNDDLTFCLNDGETLIAAPDPEATVLSAPHANHSVGSNKNLIIALLSAALVLTIVGVTAIYFLARNQPAGNSGATAENKKPGHKNSTPDNAKSPTNKTANSNSNSNSANSNANSISVNSNANAAANSNDSADSETLDLQDSAIVLKIAADENLIIVKKSAAPPNPLALVVTISADGEIKLNQENQTDAAKLGNRLTEIFAERSKNKIMDKDVTVAAPRRKIEREKFLEIIQAVKETGAKPINLEVGE